MDTQIREDLLRMRDTDYRDFQIRLIPTVDPETVIGVRTPELRSYAKELRKRGGAPAFLNALPHACFDENQLHAFLISEIRDYSQCLEEVERFLPYVDNWATCDQLSPKVFQRHRRELREPVLAWIHSEHTYTLRFGIGMLMRHFLDEDFDTAYPEMLADIRSEEYYVRMMLAWYFATALAKRYAQILPFMEKRRLDPWTHNKAIQKAAESFRVNPEQKAYLKSLKIKGKGKV